MQLRAVLDYPAVYRFFTSVVGGSRNRRRFADTYVRAVSGDRVLDLGCGPADILAYLPDVEYIGIDTNSAYVENAKVRWGDRGTFISAPVAEGARQQQSSFDIVLAIGVLHHLTDDEATELFRVACDALRPDGRLVTLDGVFVKGQSPIARLLLSQDRGRHVRTLPEYQHLAQQTFEDVTYNVTHSLIAPVPYTHLIMECTKKRP
jgi:cyclopropane fatty-acyl-phospholipid synthase-like methyltransferase